MPRCTRGCAKCLSVCAVVVSKGDVIAMLLLLPPSLQGFDWSALGARRMEPPRKPKASDHAKRKVGGVTLQAPVVFMDSMLLGWRQRSGTLARSPEEVVSC